MPVGNIGMGPQIIQAYNAVKPRTILDIGIGFGYWGVTIRNYTGANPETGEMDMRHIHIDGVEIFPKYRNPFWAAYNQVYEGNIKDILHILPNYDLVMAIDLVEHLPRHVTRQIVRKSRNFILGVCTVMSEEHKKSPYGNIKENHKTLWTMKEFQNMGALTACMSEDYFVVWRY